MLKVLHLVCFLCVLSLLQPIKSVGLSDYDNEINDYYQQESNNEESVRRQVSYDCKSEGFHPDQSDCRIFYRCVKWENKSPLTSFKFECGIGTVFSPSKGNVCVHPDESGRPECCEPSNEIDSNESGNSDSLNKKTEPSYSSPNSPIPNQISQPEKSPIYIPLTQNSHPTNSPPYNTKTQYESDLLQSQKPIQPGYPQHTNSPQSNYPSQTQEREQPNYLTPIHTVQYPNYSSDPNIFGVNQCNGSVGSSCASSIGCINEGFYPNPKDCHKFYRCVNEGFSLKRYDFTCGTGTAWDQMIQTCDHENNVPNCNFTSENEDQYGLSVSNGVASDSETPYLPSITQDNQSKWPNTDGIMTSSLSTIYTLLQTTQRPTRPTYLPPQGPVQPINSVQSQLQSTKATEYIQPTLPNSFPSYNNGVNNGVEAIDTGGRPCAPTGSSKDCKENGFFPNTKNCHKFYRCVIEDGLFKKYDFECGTGTAWDQQLQTCIYENTVISCGNSQNLSNSPDYDSSPITHKPNIGSKPENEKSNFTSTSLKPSTYPSIIQSSYIPIQNTSPSSLVSNAQSIPQVTQPSSELAPQDIGQPEIPSNVQPVPSTQSTIQPSSHFSTLSPSQQQTTSPLLENQSTSNFNTDRPQNSNNYQCFNEGFFANPNDCRKFYRCVSNPPKYIKYDFDCAPGTAWDQSLLTCNYIAQVASCNQKQNESKPNQSNQSVPVTETSAQNSTKPGLENPNNLENSSSIVFTTSTKPSLESSSKPNCDTQKSNNTIVCNSAGFYPHPIHCDKFYRCVDNGMGFNIYYFDCPAGTIFDPSIEVCNYPQSVYPARDCNTGESQGNTSPQDQSSTMKEITTVKVKPEDPDSTTSSSLEITSESITSSSVNKPLTIRTTEANSESPISSSEATIVSSNTTPNPVTTSLNLMTTPNKEETTMAIVTTTLNFQTTVPNSETTISTSEETTATPEEIISSSETTTSTSESTTLSSEVTIISSESTTPSFEETTPSSESTTPSFEETTPSSESITPSFEETTPSSESTTPSFEETTPSSESTTPSFEETTSSSESTTPNFEETTLSSESTTSNTEVISTNSESSTIESEATTASVDTSSTETTTSEEQSTSITSAMNEITTTDNSESTVSVTDTSSPLDQQSTITISTQQTTVVAPLTTDSQELTTISSTEKPSIIDNCPTLANLTDDQIVLICPTGFRRHPKLCNLFYQCTMFGNMEVKILILQCPENTVFDEKSNKCLTQSESSQPCKGTIAGKRIQRGVTNEITPLIEVSRKPLCPKEGHFPYRDGCSNIFYKCGRNSKYELEGYLFKCPKDFVYWSVSRRCERRSRLPTCTRMSNDTENENRAWEKRWEIPVEDRNLSARSLFLF